MAKSQWTTDDIPLLEGKIMVVTGANSGLGYETSKALAAKGAQVVMACRNIDKGETAATDIKVFRFWKIKPAPPQKGHDCLLNNE